ncbi:MAG: hypothetical protein OEW58_11565 [Gammaproteobacteria bacterium]|nr:hypothetical protein [Gammaproteobacteria bacterium]
MQRQKKIFKLLLVAGLLLPLSSWAKGATSTCYGHINYGERIDTHPKRALYIIVDQTIDMSKSMPSKIAELVHGWGQPGDLIKIARFSANMRDHFPSVEYTVQWDPRPSEKYLYSLRWSDKKLLEECLQRQAGDRKEALGKALRKVLAGTDSRTPKTEIFNSLKTLSKYMLDRDIKDKAVLIISDGLENSPVTNFYGHRGVRKVDTLKEMNKVRRQGLVSNWNGARIYLYGLGLPPQKQKFVDMNTVQSLSKFWEHYFVEGEGKVVAFGTPELLISSIE